MQTYMVFIKLEELPREHTLRNTPLIELNAFYSLHGSAFRGVFPNFGIAKKTYNQLGKVWIDNHSWEVRNEKYV